MNGKYSVGDVVLDNWTLVKPLGEGAYGKVYEAHRVEYQNTYTAAVKIMTIPSSPGEIESARAEGMDEESIRAYFDGFVGSVVNEFTLMSELKGTANIVSCEDFRVIPHTEGLGWDILIRMELLTPMLKYMSGREMTRSDVIKLGVDMCKALELCQRYNIIHRDIKPENIFLSRTGDYKLGDFGVARTLEKTTGGLSKKGTYTYMAPEIYRDEKYGPTVDIYSLGIVLYRLLNNNRAPFLPPPPQPISYSERERALQRRVSGEALPPPANAGGRLGEIVLKACAFEAKDRYQSPQQMRQELEAIRDGADEELGCDSEETLHMERAQYTGHSNSDDADATVYEPHSTSRSAKAQPTPAASVKKKKTALLAAIAAALVLGAIALLVLLPKGKPAEPAASAAPAPAEETAGPVSELLSEPAPEDSWDWSLTGGVLTLSGTGAVADHPAPWSDRSGEITQIVIGNGITQIAEAAFSGCGKLAAIEVAADNPAFRSVDGVLFAKDGKTLLCCPAGKAEGSYAVPEGVAAIGAYAFDSCLSLTELTIPGSVETIGESAFRGCGALAEVALAPDSRNYKTVDGVLFSQDGKTLLFYPRNTANAAYEVPEGVTAIGSCAFEYCDALTELTLPEGLLSIGEAAFGDCSALQSLTIPASVETIGEEAFRFCSAQLGVSLAQGSRSYKTVGGVLYSQDGRQLLFYPSSKKDAVFAVPEGVVSLSRGLFSNCGYLTTVTVPESVGTIDGETFSSCGSLSRIEVASGNPGYQSIDGVLFTKDGKTLIRYPAGKASSYSVPEGVSVIGNSAFAYCVDLKSVSLPDSLTAIGSSAFASCEALRSLTIPSGVVRIGDAAFSRCLRLTSMTIPEGVSVIGRDLFSNCGDLRVVTIPASVTEIGSGAFSGCDMFSDIYYAGSEKQWAELSIGSGNEVLGDAEILFQAS